jgi:uncharacterized protein YbjQ (UPF0145 family)
MGADVVVNVQMETSTSEVTQAVSEAIACGTAVELA